MRVIAMGMLAATLVVAGCDATATSASTAAASTDSAGFDSTVAQDVGGTDDASTADAAAPDVAADDVAVDPPCPSNKMWTKGNQGSALMQPGVACIACHNKSGGEAPGFVVAGTVYPSLHAVDKCYGSTATKVEIIGSNGVVTTLTTNSAGNFYQSKFGSKIVMPYTAKVYNAAGDMLEMTTPQTNGDCNSCHTPDGASNAPGRIIAP